MKIGIGKRLLLAQINWFLKYVGELQDTVSEERSISIELGASEEQLEELDKASSYLNSTISELKARIEGS